LETERAVLVPNVQALRLIQQLRSAGSRIIFISDSYLPAKFVRAQLLHHCAAMDDDGIYVSSDIGVTKRSGALFVEAMKRETADVKELHHYGDNSNSDFRVPRKLGIGATLFTETKLNAWECSALSPNVETRENASLIAASMRNFRVNGVRHLRPEIRYLVATFLGPATLLWAAWVLATAQRDRVQRLYFVARDANLVAIAARLLSPQFDNIECRYLKISRQSILLPATNEISPSGMPWLQRPWEPPSLERIIAKIGLRWENVSNAFSALAQDKGTNKLLMTTAEWDHFWYIAQRPPVRDLINEQIQGRKATTLAFLEAQGLNEPTRSGLVDIGWYATVQAGLQKLIGNSLNKTPLGGYYLALSSDHLPAGLAGETTALFYGEAPDQPSTIDSHEIFKRATVLEHVFGLALHGTVSEYQHHGSVVEPICASVPPLHAEIVSAVQEAIEAYCIENRHNALTFSDTASAREIVDKLIRCWCSNPNKTSLGAFTQATVSDDPNNLDSRPLLEPWRAADVLKLLLPARIRNRLGIKFRQPVWPEAALLLPRPWLLKILRWRRGMSAPTE
ncbi:MAG TPA: hypothetical protein VLK33_02160, partial [Terriglobales bacterium]|nr:hypothetical protein [Terriglobales bacterium]